MALIDNIKIKQQFGEEYKFEVVKDEPESEYRLSLLSSGLIYGTAEFISADTWIETRCDELKEPTKEMIRVGVRAYNGITNRDLPSVLAGVWKAMEKVRRGEKS